MSWEIFRCDIDCADDPSYCISEHLYKSQADAMVAGGFAAHGYNSIHMDDCWEQKHPPRDPATNKLRADPTRFPSGMKALGDYYHARNLSFAAYTAESPTTCGGYPASAKHEVLDANTFAAWGVDYMKVDGCGAKSYYAGGYKAMGAALQASGRDIVYSCSWPAYIGSNESEKPFQTFINDGCHLWRNWDDIQCSWNSLSSIIDHWGEWGKVLQPWAGPDGPYGGHWHDMDMLLIGGMQGGSQGHAGRGGPPCVSLDEERTQMAIWCISAAPLIMGNDMRNVSASSKAILFNRDAIAVSQDRAGKMGIRISGDVPQQLWVRELAKSAAGKSRAAVGLYNKGGAPPTPPMPPAGHCPDWTHTTGGYYEACGGAVGDIGQFSNLTYREAEAACCANIACAGFSLSGGAGYYKGNAGCGITKSSTYKGYTKTSQIPLPPPSAPVDITLTFADVPGYDGTQPVEILDIWTGRKSTEVSHYVAKGVPLHGTAFLTMEW